MYDIFYVSRGNIVDKEWQKIKNLYPTAQAISNVTSLHQIQLRSFTKMFWIIWDDLELSPEFDLQTYRTSKWDDMYIHVFRNGDFFDGICLFPKNIRVSTKEFNYRFFTNKKEVDIVASTPKPYDVVMISYEELNADKNYQLLLDQCPSAKRVHGVEGIHQAHIAAANLCNSDLFWVVDGDASIVDTFEFNYRIPYYDHNAKNSVHVWRSKNPINDLEYGYGGVKLLPKQLTIDMDVNKPDMTTSISSSFISVNEISNITEFNTDPFNTWKSAFRECCKLSSKIIDRQHNSETEDRLNTWCTKGHDRPFGKWAVSGAIAGRQYGTDNKLDIDRLKKINDFNWLKQEFDKHHG